jgi:hypothetical protein
MTAHANDAPLPGTRDELLALHRELRAKRNAAELGGAAWQEAVAALERVEIEVARIERAMDPPQV